MATRKPHDKDVVAAIKMALDTVKDDRVEEAISRAFYQLIVEFPKVRCSPSDVHPYRKLVTKHMMQVIREGYNGVPRADSNGVCSEHKEAP